MPPRDAGAHVLTSTLARDDERARALILRHGWNATAYQLLNPGIDHWFSAAGDALVGYASYAQTRVVAGAPVCTADRLAAVVAEFASDASSAGQRVCYFGAGARLEELVRHDGLWSVAALGAQPSWNPASWPDIVRRRASVRAQLNRARNKSVQVQRCSHPDPAHLAALRQCLAQWLDDRHLPTLHFLVEPETLDRLADRRLFLATQNDVLVGFLLASPVPARNGWLVEQLIRGRGAPNGTTELLLDQAMRELAADGATYVTLGLSPLSAHSQFDVARMPWWLRTVLRMVRAHGRRFYDFQGLDRFKQKFEPEAWEEIVALTPQSHFPIRGLWAIAGVFARGSPIVLMVRAVARGAAQEVRWLLTRARQRGSQLTAGQLTAERRER